MFCDLSLLLNIKEGVEEQFPEVRENSLYEKLWNHLDKRELHDFRSTKSFSYLLIFFSGNFNDSKIITKSRLSITPPAF